jgi:PAS domain S-box-containing protein
MHDQLKSASSEESIFELAFNNSQVGIAVWGPDREFLRANAAYLKFFGRTEAELIGRARVGELGLSPDREAIDLIEKLIAGDIEKVELDRPYRQPDGVERWYHAILIPVRDQHGKLQRMVSNLTEITALKQTELALADREEQYRLLAENQSDYVQLLSVDGVVLYSSPSLERLIGKQRPLGWKIGEPGSLLHPDDVEPVRAALKQMMLTGKPMTGAHRWLMPDGEVRWIEGAASVVPDDQGKPSKILTCMRDITDRKRAEEALAAREEQYRLLAENHTDYIQLFAPDGRILYDSPSLVRIIGNRHLGERKLGLGDTLLHPEDRDRVKAAFFEMVESGKSMELSYRWILPSGEVRWAETRTQCILGPDGQTSQVLSVARDITDRKRIEEQIREMQKLDAIGQLTGGLAHDFNNLLGIVVGNLDLISELLPQGSPALTRAVDSARNAALRGAEVTRSLLAVARRQTLEVKSHDINLLLSDLLPLLKSSVGSAVTIRTELHDGALMAQLDETGLSNAVLNLAINARDAMADLTQERILTIRSWSEQVDQDSISALRPGRYAVVEIADNGSGMSENVRAQAFEPFFTTKDRKKGTGLGLAMVYGYAKQLGGTALLQSESGLGTSVRLYLPMA